MRMTPQAIGTIAILLCAAMMCPAPASAARRSKAKKSAKSSALRKPITDVELMHQALYSCRHLSKKRRAKIDLKMFQRMLQLERENKVPVEFRGMTLAKACIESGYTSGIRGDCKKDNCKAVGIIQLWPWTRRFGVDRNDPYASVRFLLERVQVGLKYLHRKCPHVKGRLPRYQLAWLRINRGPKQHGKQRCEGLPHGLRLLKKWQKNIDRARRKQLLAERREARKALRRLARTGQAPATATATTSAPRGR